MFAILPSFIQWGGGLVLSSAKTRDSWTGSPQLKPHNYHLLLFSQNYRFVSHQVWRYNSHFYQPLAIAVVYSTFEGRLFRAEGGGKAYWYHAARLVSVLVAENIDQRKSMNFNGIALGIVIMPKLIKPSTHFFVPMDVKFQMMHRNGPSNVIRNRRVAQKELLSCLVHCIEKIAWKRSKENATDMWKGNGELNTENKIVCHEYWSNPAKVEWNELYSSEIKYKASL